MNTGLIGAGLQGKRRARALKQLEGVRLVSIADTDIEAAGALAEDMDCQATSDWEEVVGRDDIDAVIICSPVYLHAQMSIAAMRNGKHVLCEKPLSRTIEEAEEMLKTHRDSKVQFKCGFNYRHHPGIKQAKEWLDEGVIGKPMHARCRHGYCGRPGYENEWKAKAEFAGGGQLMEQGIHILDLFRWFIGDFSQVTGFVSTSYWDIAPLEDNAFVLLSTAKGQIASLHSSLTEWKNLFSFEIFGQDGYIRVEGLGGSYGTEKVILGKRAFGEPFREETTEYRGDDRSLYEELREFVTAIEENREPSGSGYDGLEALRLVFAAYESSSKNCVVKLGND